MNAENVVAEFRILNVREGKHVCHNNYCDYRKGTTTLKVYASIKEEILSKVNGQKLTDLAENFFNIEKPANEKLRGLDLTFKVKLRTVEKIFLCIDDEAHEHRFSLTGNLAHDPKKLPPNINPKQISQTGFSIEVEITGPSENDPGLTTEEMKVLQAGRYPKRLQAIKEEIESAFKAWVTKITLETKETPSELTV